ncbi:hypothetical protein [Ideonella sp. YS5]|uniref:hypothetical protein n=1 Tax=Ideonella sp. YS5 TaxID=3453714 RepID=UPI003EEB24B8
MNPSHHLTCFVPRQVFLFSGHMIDAPGRPSPRFPPSCEAAAAREIGAVLDRLGAGPGDLAISQAAAGGDILFLEAAEARGLRCQVMLPFDEPEFIRRSILPSCDGPSWRDRWLALQARLVEPTRVMHRDLGPTPLGVDDFERANDWLMDTALGFGPAKVRFICLWNGAGGDGPGGTQHMMDEVRRHAGQAHWIDTRTLC